MDAQDPCAELTAFLQDNPGVTGIDMLLPDMNGIPRGKRIARDGASKLYSDGVRMPGSTYVLDATGRNVDTLPYGSSDGDPDYTCHAVPGTLKPVPWSGGKLAQVVASMREDSGAPFFADPRQIVARAAEPLRAMGLTPVAALELEFYLLHPKPGPDGRFAPAFSPLTGTPLTTTQVYGLEELYDFEEFLSEVEAACLAQGVPADTATSEYAPGQFEINLHHVADPVAACDHAMLLKRIVKGVAKAHGLLATFMAKPFQEFAGSGMHIHVSLIDRDGRNVFAADAVDAETGLPCAQTLKHAIGGLQAAMAESMAIFAPNANSYRRLVPGSYAPINRAWGVNNRTVSLRIPDGPPQAMRVEHRPAGADASPYLVLAAVLAGIHHGLANHIDPGPIERGDAYARARAPLPRRWNAALGALEQGDILKRYLGEEYMRVFAAARRFESDAFHAVVQPLDYEWYLRVV